MSSVNATLTGAAQSTAWLEASQGVHGKVVSAISGTFVGTIALEAKRLNGLDADRYEVITYTAPDFTQHDLSGAWEVRLTMTAFTSGSADASLFVDH